LEEHHQTKQNHHSLSAGVAEEDEDEEDEDEKDDSHRMVEMHRWVCGREHWDEEGCRVVDDGADYAVVEDLMRRTRY
jgi:hypothetical protein